MKKFIAESWLVLVLGVVFAVLLAGAQSSLQARIKVNQAEALRTAIRVVVPGTETTEEVQDFKIDGQAIPVYECRDADGGLAGWAIQHGGPGFIDRITIVAGLSPDLSQVNAITALAHLETPGLGSKIEGAWADQFRQKPADVPLQVVKGNPGAADQIQAITGATYSSQYVTDIVNDILQKIRPVLAERAK